MGPIVLRRCEVVQWAKKVVGDDIVSHIALRCGNGMPLAACKGYEAGLISGPKRKLDGWMREEFDSPKKITKRARDAWHCDYGLTDQFLTDISDKAKELMTDSTIYGHGC